MLFLIEITTKLISRNNDEFPLIYFGRCEKHNSRQRRPFSRFEVLSMEYSGNPIVCM